MREATRAVLARDPGRDPVIVRAALEEELAKCGMTQPDSDHVERMTRMLVAVQGPFASVRLGREAWRFVGEVREAVRSMEGPEWLKPPPGLKVGTPTSEDPNGAGDIVEVAEVELADGVQPLLAKAFAVRYDPTYDDEGELAATCKVWIDTRRVPAAGTPLPVILGSELIGTLVDEDALALESDLRKAEDEQLPLILEATIEQETDSFGVWVVVPSTA